METSIPSRLATLGHPQRLAVFRSLMRRYPDHVPATELARALALKANTLSSYVNALMQAGLVRQLRVGTSRRYAVDMQAARETVDFLLRDCCRGRAGDRFVARCARMQPRSQLNPVALEVLAK